MRHRLVLVVLVLFALALGGVSTAQAKPTAGEKPANHGQCVSSHSQPSGKGGRSVVAKDKEGCTPQLVCTENEDTPGTVTLDSQNNTVTVAGSGEGSDGSNLACATAIKVKAGDTLTFTYELGADTDPCGGGVPRMYVLIDGTYYNTIDGDPECSQASDKTVTYVIPVGGTIDEVAFVYDRGDFGSVTYSDAAINGVPLNI